MEMKFGRGKPNATVKNADGAAVTQMKVVVRMQELNQVMEFIRRMNGKNAHQIPTTQRAVSMEERRILLWRRKFATRGGSTARTRDFNGRRRAWRPVLKSIPEDLYV